MGISALTSRLDKASTYPRLRGTAIGARSGLEKYSACPIKHQFLEESSYHWYRKYFSPETSAGCTTLEDDLELKLITARKLAEMRKRVEKAAAESVPKVQKSNKEVVLGMLVDRGDEVLETAYQYYPKETQAIVDQLAKLIKDGRVENKVSGGEFYSILRQLGMRFSLNTTIKVQEKGRLVDLAEKLRSKDEPS